MSSSIDDDSWDEEWDNEPAVFAQTHEEAMYGYTDGTKLNSGLPKIDTARILGKEEDESWFDWVNEWDMDLGAADDSTVDGEDYGYVTGTSLFSGSAKSESEEPTGVTEGTTLISGEGEAWDGDEDAFAEDEDNWWNLLGNNDDDEAVEEEVRAEDRH